MDEGINVWGLRVPLAAVTNEELDYLRPLGDGKAPSLNWVWSEMDRVWDELGLDNRQPLTAQRVSDFYSHPVWLMNGIYTATDPVSIAHRSAIAEQVKSLNCQSIADFGGGLGELALIMSAENPSARVTIVEPYSSKLLRHRIHASPVQLVSRLEGQHDCVIAQDVLEHVENPLELARQLVLATRLGGHLIFANCFAPVIKCHLPCTFYLRYTFSFLMEGFGLHAAGSVAGAPHAFVYRRTRSDFSNHLVARKNLALAAGSLLNITRSCLSRLKHSL